MLTFANAEYRAFWLQIKPKVGDISMVKSCLDPDQYRGYFHVPDEATVTYTETWMCRGRTDRRPICKSPKEMAAELAEEAAAKAAENAQAPQSASNLSPERAPASQ